MKQLQSRLIAIIISGILLATFINALISLLSFLSVAEERSVSILNKELKLSASYINETFRDTEKFTNTLSEYCLEHCPEISKLMSSEGASYINICKEFALTMIEDNEIMCATYFRLNPDISTPTSGFFLSATSDNHSVTEQAPTDISAYDSSDISRVGWYYIPVEAKKSIWMDEYFNENNGILMISYVTPLFLEDGTLLGVVGIDINMNKVYNHFSAVRLYDTGFEAIMSDNGEIKNSAKDINLTKEDKAKILGSKEGLSLAYYDRQKEMTLMTEPLTNGDYLLLAIQNDDLYETENRIILTIIIITIFVCTLVIMFLTTLLFRIIHRFRTDDLTQTENRGAYSDEIGDIDHSIRSGKENCLTVIVFDINCLKKTNDELGHAAGDRLIKKAADTIRSYFPEMTIFRIGGDEFVICSRHPASNALLYRLEQFRDEMSKQALDYDLKSQAVVISSGIATYDVRKDNCYEDVFRRADRDMYNDKKYFYQLNPDLDIRSSDSE